ncbi:hypothetical protein YM3MPS_49000 [Mycobacterium pseudoshottsii]|nr:hypothetical protein [Mycobacterium pseudoshottsii]BEH79097.1 hypothetical protein YM3MPS_49000 [Mycobacterium pseudoshottsii]
MATVADMSRFRMVITSTICTTVICTGATAITLTNVNPATATACMTGTITLTAMAAATSPFPTAITSTTSMTDAGMPPTMGTTTNIDRPLIAEHRRR